jgi:transposase
MQQLNELNDQELVFLDSVKALEKVNKQLAKLLAQKEELTKNIIDSLEHDHEGQKTYEYGVWKIEVKTPCVFSLNKKLYESGEFKLPSEFNPIKQSVSYSIDKRLCEKYMTDSPKKVREALIELIEKKPGKASVCLRERV